RAVRWCAESQARRSSINRAEPRSLNACSSPSSGPAIFETKPVGRELFGGEPEVETEIAMRLPTLALATIAVAGFVPAASAGQLGNDVIQLAQSQQGGATQTEQRSSDTNK